MNIVFTQKKQAPFLIPRFREKYQYKVNIVIISQNQEKSLPLMINALNKYCPSFPRIFVLDRCTDNSKNILINAHEKFVENTIGIGFCAGTARNIGINKCDPTSDILCFDGDRIPYNLSEDLIYNALYNYDITLFKAKIDDRKWFSDDFTYNINYGKTENHVWTAAFLIRREAIENISKISNNNLFDNLFDGEYGFEDVHMGDLAYHIGLTCGGFPSNVYLNGKLVYQKLDPTSRIMKEQIKLRSYMRSFLRHRGNYYNKDNFIFSNIINKNFPNEPKVKIKNSSNNINEKFTKNRNRIISLTPSKNN